MLTSADLLFFAAMVAVTAVIVVASSRLGRRAMSWLLVSMVLLCLVVMALFQALDINVCGATPAHSALFALAQGAVYYLAFKLWLALNYDQLAPRARVMVHLCAFAMFTATVCGNFWLRSQHPVLLTFLYPGFSLTQTLVVQAVERRLARGEAA